MKPQSQINRKKLSRGIRIFVRCLLLTIFVPCWLYLYSNLAYSKSQPDTTRMLKLTPTVRIATKSITIAPSPTTNTRISVSSTPDYISDWLQAINVVLQASYVTLTLILVRATLESNKANQQSSKDSLQESRNQSQAAIDVVHEQIEESRNQSQNAIDAIHKQIEENRRQVQETIYNQSRPILVTISLPDLDKPNFKIKNVGTGVATNIKCLLSIRSTSYGGRAQYYFQHTSAIGPNEDDKEQLHIRMNYPTLEKIGEYFCFPEATDAIHNNRLVITYHDAFNRKHISIFDGIPFDVWTTVELESGVTYEL